MADNDQGTVSRKSLREKLDKLNAELENDRLKTIRWWKKLRRACSAMEDLRVRIARKEKLASAIEGQLKPLKSPIAEAAV